MKSVFHSVRAPPQPAPRHTVQALTCRSASIPQCTLPRRAGAVRRSTPSVSKSLNKAPRITTWLVRLEHRLSDQRHRAAVGGRSHTDGLGTGHRAAEQGPQRCERDRVFGHHQCQARHEAHGPTSSGQGNLSSVDLARGPTHLCAAIGEAVGKARQRGYIRWTRLWALLRSTTIPTSRRRSRTPRACGTTTGSSWMRGRCCTSKPLPHTTAIGFGRRRPAELH